jgi:hypothetical protein
LRHGLPDVIRQGILKGNFKEKNMKIKILGLTTAIALSMIAAGEGALWAQGMALGGWESPQSVATLGRIRSAADDFITPDSYTSARIGNWFGVASFQSGSTAHLGYAKQLKKAYIGVYYGGTFWAGLEKFDYTEGNVSDWPGGAKTVPVYNDLTINGTPNNRIALLIGVADMGFRLSYYTTHQSFNKKDIGYYDGTNEIAYKSYKTDVGLMSPQLAWSMTKNLAGDKGIKPYVTVDLNFNRNYVKVEEATTDAGPGEHVVTSANWVEPIFQVGLGGFNLYSKDAFRLSADLEYRLTLRAWNNELSYTGDDGKYKTIKVKGLYSSDTAITEQSYVNNWIRPSLSAQWGSGPLALRLRLDLVTQIRSEGKSELERDDDKLVKNGDDLKTTTFSLNPDFRLALQWRFIPKLALNAGGRINVNAWQVATTKGSIYTDDKEDDDASYKDVKKTFGNTTNQLFLGTTFNPTDNLAFEAVIGATASNAGVDSSNRINVFSTSGNGLFDFGSILVSLKF